MESRLQKRESAARAQWRRADEGTRRPPTWAAIVRQTTMRKTKGFAMKAIMSGLAALLVSLAANNTASAQAPVYPLTPVAFAAPGHASAAQPGGCSTCGGAASGGLLSKLGVK